MISFRRNLGKNLKLFSGLIASAMEILQWALDSCTAQSNNFRLGLQGPLKIRSLEHCVFVFIEQSN